jgi:hypothetical protein
MDEKIGSRWYVFFVLVDIQVVTVFRMFILFVEANDGTALGMGMGFLVV